MLLTDSSFQLDKMYSWSLQSVNTVQNYRLMLTIHPSMNILLGKLRRKLSPLRSRHHWLNMRYSLRERSPLLMIGTFRLDMVWYRFHYRHN